MAGCEANSCTPDNIPEPGDAEFIGPQSEEQYREMEMAYLPASIAPHAREIIHNTVEAQLSRLAVAQQIDISALDNVQKLELRRRVFASRIRNRKT